MRGWQRFAFIFVIFSMGGLCQSCSIQHNMAEQHIKTGHADYRKGDNDAAIKEYRQAIELDPNDALAHSALGYILGLGPLYQEAE